MRKVEQNLLTYYHRPENGSIHLSKEKTAMYKTIRLAELELTRKQKKKRKGFLIFLLEQMRMTGMRIWIGQTGMSMMIFLLVYFMTGVDVLFFTTRRLAFLVSILGIFLFSSAIPFLYRAKKYGMLEIESTSRYSIGKLLLSRIIIISVGDLFVLAGSAWQISKSSGLTVWQSIFWLCLPFMIAFNGGVYLLRKVVFIHFQVWAYGMCLFMCSMLVGLALVHPEYYQVELTIFSGGIVIVLIGSMMYQSFALFQEAKQCVFE